MPPPIRGSLSLTRWIISQLAPYRVQLAWLAVLSTAEIAFRVMLPWSLTAVVDHAFGPVAAPGWLRAVAFPVSEWVTPDPRAALLVTIVVLGFALQAGHLLILLAHTWAFTAVSQRVTRDLRQSLFAHLQCLTLAHHSRTPTGDAVYRLTADAGCLEQILLRAALPAMFSAATLVVMFGVLLRINTTLALVSLAVVPGLVLSLRAHGRRVKGEAENVKHLESRVIERAQESLSAIRLVKAFAREPYEQARFEGAADTAMRARVLLSRKESGFSFATGAITGAGSALVLGTGGLLVLRGEITPGTLLLVLAYIGFVYGPLTAMTSSTAVVRDALASARRVSDVFALNAEPLDRRGARPLPRLRGAVQFDRVTFAYDDGAPVLEDVSLAVAPGEFVAIVGPSGGGKTTLMNLLTRLYEPAEGRVLVDGLDVRSLPLSRLRQQVAVVLQEAVLLSGSVRENLLYGRLDATDGEIEDAARLAGAHEFIMRLEHGYDTPLGQAGAGLSGGQRQRLSIARAFLKDAPILVLDEPTSALDTVSESRFVEALERLRGGRTTFVIAHRLSTVRRADRIVVIDGGRLVAEGTHGSLLRESELYAKLTGTLVAALEEPESLIA